MPPRSLPAMLLALCLVLLFPATALAATQATSSSGAEAVLVDMINDRRADAGLPALTTRADLHGIARDWSFAQAERGQMGHNPNLTSQACCWTKVAENVARSGGHAGDGATGIARALMQLWRHSSSHDDTMTDRDVDQLGVGIVIDDGGTAWATAVFRTCDGSACAGGAQGPAGDRTVSWAPAPAPEPEPAPEPAREPEPETETEPVPEPAPEPEPEQEPETAQPPAPPSPPPAPSPVPSPTPPPVPAAPLVAASLSGEPAAAGPGGASLAIVVGGALALVGSGVAWRRRT